MPNYFFRHNGILIFYCLLFVCSCTTLDITAHIIAKKKKKKKSQLWSIWSGGPKVDSKTFGKGQNKWKLFTLCICSTDSNWMTGSWPLLPGGRVPWLHRRHFQRYTLLHLSAQKSPVCEAQVLPARLPLPVPASLLQPHRAVQLHWWVSGRIRDD